MFIQYYRKKTTTNSIKVHSIHINTECSLLSAIWDNKTTGLKTVFKHFFMASGMVLTPLSLRVLLFMGEGVGIRTQAALQRYL
jgi:hypothetical protein